MISFVLNSVVMKLNTHKEKYPYVLLPHVGPIHRSCITSHLSCLLFYPDYADNLGGPLKVTADNSTREVRNFIFLYICFFFLENSTCTPNVGVSDSTSVLLAVHAATF